MTTEIVLTTGQKITAVSVSDTVVNLVKDAVKQDFIERGEPIEPPTYNVIVAGGGVREEPHDETTLESDEDKEIWAKHQDALRRLNQETNIRVLKVWLTGLDIKLPESNDWIEHQKWLGVRFSQKLLEDKNELLYHYLTTEILKSPEDLFRSIDAIMKETYKGVVKEADLDAMMDSFRHQAQRSFSPVAKNQEG